MVFKYKQIQVRSLANGTVAFIVVQSNCQTGAGS